MEMPEANEWVTNHTTQNRDSSAPQSETDRSCLRWLMALESKDEDLDVSSMSGGSSVATADCFDCELLSDDDSDEDDSDSDCDSDSDDDSDEDSDSDDSSSSYDSDDDDDYASLCEELEAGRKPRIVTSSATKSVAANTNPHEWTLPANTILPNLQDIFREAAKNPNVDIQKTIHASFFVASNKTAAQQA